MNFIKISIFSILCIFSLNAKEAKEEIYARLIKHERIEGMDIKKIEFCLHTYIVFKSTWNGRGNIIHDPDCKCVLEAVNKILEKK